MSDRPARDCRTRPRPFAIATATLLVLAPWLGCGGAKSECHAESWSGSCQLLGITKVKDVELPLPSVVIEAIYRPVAAPGAPPPTLPDVRREFTALSKHEDALRKYLESQTPARCYVNPPPPGQCFEGQIVVEVADFDATGAASNAQDSSARGCAQIEAASSQDRVTQNQGDAELIPERLQFAEASAELAPDAAALVDSVAQRLKDKPELECVGVIGQWVRGESMEIAFARARAVRELLIARGVEPARLVALTVSGELMTTSTATPEAPDPKDRRVAFSVLLDVKPAR